jgi:hypothetical protein
MRTPPLLAAASPLGPWACTVQAPGTLCPLSTRTPSPIVTVLEGAARRDRELDSGAGDTAGSTGAPYAPGGTKKRRCPTSPTRKHLILPGRLLLRCHYIFFLGDLRDGSSCDQQAPSQLTDMAGAQGERQHEPTSSRHVAQLEQRDIGASSDDRDRAGADTASAGAYGRFDLAVTPTLRQLFTGVLADPSIPEVRCQGVVWLEAQTMLLRPPYAAHAHVPRRPSTPTGASCAMHQVCRR